VAISIVVGGQYGSEGKGKVAHYLARERNAAAAVRVGGPNSGHTVYDDAGRKFIFQHLPTAAVLPDVICVLAAGSYIDVDRLLHEVTLIGLPARRLKVDPNAVVISGQHRVDEHFVGLRAGIGSTLTGTGAAVLDRVSRVKPLRFAKDEPLLAKYVCETKPYLRGLLDQASRVVIEGTQGYGLSVLHNRHYPYATSRDTTAAGFLSEVGLSPLDVDEIALVIRAFPIRVPGNSGPLEHECTWADVTESAGAPSMLTEMTSVTQSLRRVARFSAAVVRDAILANRPTIVVLNHVDYWDHACRQKGAPSERARVAVANVEGLICRRVDYIGLDEFDIQKVSRTPMEAAA
jgi:adenylosuccinate synthase